MINLQDNYSLQAGNDYFQVAICSAIGNRKEQQDRAGYGLTNTEGVVAVCDGMGGHSGGKNASIVALEQFLQEWRNREVDTMPQRFLVETVVLLDKLVAALKNPDGTALKAGTTFSAVLLEDRQLHWVSVGDSRIYIYRSPEFVRITNDHTYQALQQEGRLPPNLPPVQNPESVLVSFLGVGNLPQIDRNRSPLTLLPGDTVLLTSDGLYKLLTDSMIASLLQENTRPTEIAQKLISSAQQKANAEQLHADNISVAVLRIK